MKIDKIMKHLCVAAILNFSAILNCYFSKFNFSFSWAKLPKYVIRSILNIITHEMTIDC
jgi:hypothetical protein